MNKKYIPYKLPELIEAVKNKNTIFIADGEKEVDTLIELGFSATTAPLDFDKKWNNICNSYIKNAKVVLIKEWGEKAIAFAEATREKLQYSAKKYTILSIPKVCNCLGIELTTTTGITEIRQELQDDEKLKRLLQAVINNLEKK